MESASSNFVSLTRQMAVTISTSSDPLSRPRLEERSEAMGDRSRRTRQIENRCQSFSTELLLRPLRFELSCGEEALELLELRHAYQVRATLRHERGNELDPVAGCRSDQRTLQRAILSRKSEVVGLQREETTSHAGRAADHQLSSRDAWLSAEKLRLA